jgi:dUTP pyrophosphatase
MEDIMTKLKFKRLYADSIIPTRGSSKASGLDLYALEEVILYPQETRLIKTGIAFIIPEGYEIQIRPRSGMSLKTKFRVANSPGTVDADYTGECCVIGFNAGSGVGRDDLIRINKGDRIAQAVLCPVVLPDLEEVENVELTGRGSQGFGSTGA